jgi:hypothetical protein
VAIDRIGRKQLEITPRQSMQEIGNLVVSEIGRTLFDQSGNSRLLRIFKRSSTPTRVAN